MTATGYPPRDRSDEVDTVVVRRAVNDEIARTAATFVSSERSRFEFVCECDDVRCRGIVRLTLAEYAETPCGSVSGHRPEPFDGT